MSVVQEPGIGVVSTVKVGTKSKQQRFPRFDMLPSVPEVRETVAKTATKLRASLLFQKPAEGDPYCRTSSSTELFEASSDFSMLDLEVGESPTRTPRRGGKRRVDAPDPFEMLDIEEESEAGQDKDETGPHEEKISTNADGSTSKTRRPLLSRWQQSSGSF